MTERAVPTGLAQFLGHRRPRAGTVLISIDEPARFLEETIRSGVRTSIAHSEPAGGPEVLDVPVSGLVQTLRESGDQELPPLVVRASVSAPDQLEELAAAWPTGGGRLLLVVPASDRREAIDRLSTSTFAILREEAYLAEGWLAIEARPTPYVVRGHRAGDEVNILELFPTSFHVERSAAHWQWKYLASPFGGPHITTAWDGDGQLAAHYAAYPVPIVSSEGHRATALQVGDTMTAVGARNAGRGPSSLLGRSVRHFYSAHCEGQVAFNFGFNTGNIRRFSQRFVRATAVEEVVVWSMAAGELLAKTERRRTSFLRLRLAERADERWDRFFRSVRSSYGSLVERSSQWLNWRYLDCPDQPSFRLVTATRWGRLRGWAVFRRQGATLQWSDALVSRQVPGLFSEMVRYALGLPEYEGVSRVEGWAPRRPQWWARELAAAGFSPGLHPDDLSLMVVPFLWADAPEQLAYSFYYTMGDGDLA